MKHLDSAFCSLVPPILALLIPCIVVAQQAPRRAPTPTAKQRAAPPPRTPAQILADNRVSVAIVVAANDTSARLGTGFFVSSGLLLTNYHVVEGTDLVGVRLHGTEEIVWATSARGYDAENDLVALEITSRNIKPVVLGDSENVRVGEPITVIGNPEGLEQSVSNGLVSGIRDLGIRKLFQISAPISSGSSGGPVFNERGEAIGVVVASFESGQNLNFAVPINYAKNLFGWANSIPIAQLPRKRISVGHSETKNQSRADNQRRAALDAIQRIADAIKACPESSRIVQTREKKPLYYRMYSGPPTDVRYDLRPIDSLVANFVGVVEFSVRFGTSRFARTPEETLNLPDMPFPFAPVTTRHRHVFRITDEGPELYDRAYFSVQPQRWILEQGTSTECWEAVGYQ